MKSFEAFKEYLLQAFGEEYDPSNLEHTSQRVWFERGWEVHEEHTEEQIARRWDY